ncbi:trans-aconitate 2-methyltransferase [Roseateles sp.]|uniref:trans-aconitate 2-methyltransferase n=1 Tax=Roseateles sp. TaxID=1971397 RepID=UPI0039EC50F7
MKDWNPDLYRRFEDERTRPARDLLARVPLQAPRRVVDLGCGPGNSAELLVQRFPDAEVIGIDSSAAMLESARERLPGCRFELADIADWTPQDAPDLIYANASLQWVGDHERLLPRLLGLLAPGGVLAVQMPDNRDEPTHRAMRELAAQPPFAALIGDASRLRTELLGLDGYYDLLAPISASLDLWRTAYQHPMDSASRIVEWVRGTGLKPFVDPLPEPERTQFLADYEQRIASSYPQRADGRLLLAFPRLFFVASLSTA